VNDERTHDDDVPDAASLLASAREALLADVLPSLDASPRYTALMIANAMAIAAREFTLGAEAQRHEVELLRPLAAETIPPSEPDEADVHDLRRIVAAAIRAGRFDDAPHAQSLMTALTQVAEERLAISNPRALRE
jgi:tRNA C32,U32 (ribose-2'-O)-methylase TrmJ